MVKSVCLVLRTTKAFATIPLKGRDGSRIINFFHNFNKIFQFAF
jgi:hypothetical protein